ncbi:alpha-amylase family glycosyl hydrolase [Flavitalea sp. BT771]|uniref:alpha-amylase family glycosyl hydrolase n=1 Tax=Flavitalea sp. BT771 TaxID=3063329 RepID=UPI0026E2BED0|nr:alpha-amylase family glycosyl hydrolase [Flavitalea sp. BT771]MDO6435732.1 alpha-amylase family glycosyl hydrolase [Flavitalea sp. BT771]MDV6224615.1 alpha-amylase family glycosyl hydrolase [Flavitalea sp. BT771]
MPENTAGTGALVKKEFLFKPFNEAIEHVDIGIFPSRGRYFRKRMDRMENFFRTDVFLPGGKSFYHFFFNGDYKNPYNNEQSVISPYDVQKRAPVVVESQIFCPLEFRNEVNYISHVRDEVWEIRAITHQTWIGSVELITGSSAYPLHLAFREKNNAYWFVRLPFLSEELKYTMKISGGGQVKYLSGDHTFVDSIPEEKLFIFPLVRTAGESCTPLKAGYQVLPDRFHIGGPGGDKRKAIMRSPAADLTGVLGGDIRGIVEKMGYIAGMGFDFIYMNPVFAARSYHRYDCSDYMSIDPVLGDDEDLRELIRKAHDWGIKVILDIALNHCSAEFHACKNLPDMQGDPVYKDWFYRPPSSLPAGSDIVCSGWHGYEDLPQFNLEHKEVRAYFRKVARYWPEAFGIDGWRLDTGTELPAGFVDEFVHASREVNPRLLVIAESWQANSKDMTASGCIDGTTNFALYWDIIIAFFQQRKLSVNQLAMRIMDMLSRNAFRVNQFSWSFASNHDVPRFFSLLRQKEHYRLAFILIYALPGTPVMYYGEETYMEGLADPFNRQCMAFDCPDHSMTDCIRALNRLREAYFDLFTYGSVILDTPGGGGHLLVVTRALQDRRLQFYINFDDSRKAIAEGAYRVNEYGVSALYSGPDENIRSVYEF